MLRVGGMLLGCLLAVRGQRGRSSIHSGLPSSGRGPAGGCTKPSRYLHSTAAQQHALRGCWGQHNKPLGTPLA
jgi:hypothetical protein